MKKIVIYDSGFGGELFADYLKEKLAIVDIVRVIDWRHADQILKDAHSAREAAKEALRPYIGKVDLIFFANNLLSLTSLKFFRRKYKNQKFAGFPFPDSSIKESGPVLVLATNSIRGTIQYQILKHRLGGKFKDISLDSWVSLIDDGELSVEDIKSTLGPLRIFRPATIVLGNTVFADIQKEIHLALGNNVAIEKGYKKAFKDICQALELRGASGLKI